mgnify:CR=1 FL=1
MRIFKYPLTINDVQGVDMPEDAKILCAQVQGTQLCLWAEVEPARSLYPRVIEIFGTGHPMEERPRRYIGTVQTYDGSLVWHVYERTAP